MSWRDRDYSQAYDGEGGRIVRGVRLPPRGALALLGLHLVTFVIVALLQTDQGLDVVSLLAISEAGSPVWAVLTHPIATARLGTLALVVVGTWTLAGRVESRFGTSRTLALYVIGNALAGVSALAITRWRAELAAAPLDFPAGALVAWGVVVWRVMGDELVPIFRRLVKVTTVMAWTAIIIGGVAVLSQGPGATAWLVGATIGGASGWLIEKVIGLAPRREKRPVAGRPRPEPAEPDVDDILAKIRREGLESLTKQERKRLEAARRAKLRHHRRN